MSNPAALTICNEALLALGEDPLDDLEGDSAANKVASLKYQPVVDEMLGGHPWTFNRAILRLARLTELPPVATGYTAAYSLPGLCFRAVVPYVNGQAERNWGEAAGRLYVDANLSDVVELEYHTRADESLWRPAFRQSVVMRLAAEFCIPITDDTARAQLMFKMADEQLRRARHLNATEKPAIRLAATRLARMRRS